MPKNIHVGVHWFTTGLSLETRKDTTILDAQSDIRLHDVDTGDSEMTPTTAVSMLDSRLVEVVCAALPELRMRTLEKRRKRRSNVATRAMESAKAARVR